MSREIPEPIRAAAGLAATVLDEARKLPETLPGLSVRVAGLAMQTALKVQQQWAGLVARGDEVFTGMRGEDEPGMATFDEDLDVPPAPGASVRRSAFDRATATVPDDDIGDDIGDDIEENLGEDIDGGALADRIPLREEDVDAVLTPEDELDSALLESDAAVAGPDSDPDTGQVDPPSDEPGGGGELAGSQAAGAAPIEGYDGFTIAQLRGRLRRLDSDTVQRLLAYEEATRAREPYVRMLRNRLEKLEREPA